MFDSREIVLKSTIFTFIEWIILIERDKFHYNKFLNSIRFKNYYF